MRPSPARGLFVEFWRELVGPPYFEYGVSLHSTTMLTRTRGKRVGDFPGRAGFKLQGLLRVVTSCRAQLALSRIDMFRIIILPLKANALACGGDSLYGRSLFVFNLAPRSRTGKNIQRTSFLRSPKPPPNPSPALSCLLVLLACDLVFACQACPDISTPPHPENREKYQPPLVLAAYSITATCKSS